MAQNTHELKKLIEGCKKARPESVALLYETYCHRMFEFFFRLSGNRAQSEDLVSEFFVKVIEKIRSYRGGSFQCWLYTIAVNTFRDQLRRQKAENALLEKAAARLAETAGGDAADELGDRDTVQLALRKLDADDRSLIVLRFWSGLSFKEIARLRNEPVGTTLSKVHRIVQTLKKHMEI